MTVTCHCAVEFGTSELVCGLGRTCRAAQTHAQMYSRSSRVMSASRCTAYSHAHTPHISIHRLKNMSTHFFFQLEPPINIFSSVCVPRLPQATFLRLHWCVCAFVASYSKALCLAFVLDLLILCFGISRNILNALLHCMEACPRPL